MNELPDGQLMDLSRAVALVSGAGSGIGASIARRFLLAGARVALVGRTARSVGDLVEPQHLSRSLYLRADLRLEEDVIRVVHETETSFGSLDIVVNNAGAQPRANLLDIEPEEWDSVAATNVRSVLLMLQNAAPRMATSGGGSFVNIASIRADRPGAGMAHYSASKAAVVALTKSAAVELGHLGIRVNAISPGLIERPGLRDSWPDGIADFERIVPLGRIGSPRDIADACLFLASPAARWITGVNLAVDGGRSLV